MKLFKNFYWKSALFRLFSYLVLFYLFIVFLSVSITSLIFFNVDSIKNYLIDKVNATTGSNLTVGSIKTQLNQYYLPQIIIDDVKYQASESNSEYLAIKHIDLDLDYSTLWRFRPIFNQIKIEGSKLNFVLESNSAIYLNGIKITDGNDLNLSMVKPLTFDIEKFLLEQKSINLNDVMITFEDKKNRIPVVTLSDIKFDLMSKNFANHLLKLTLFGHQHKNNLHINLDWNGGKLEDISDWHNANLNVVTNYTESQNTVQTLQSVIHASIKDGLLQDVSAHFDVNDFDLILKDLNVINVPDFDGDLSIVLHDNSKYIIKGTNLKVASASGYLFDNSQIDGEYIINQKGYINLSNANIGALDNFLLLFPQIGNLHFSGAIDYAKYSWGGAISKPIDYNLNTHFTNLSVSSPESTIPSINNITGEVSLDRKKGSAKIQLDNSVFTYDSLFFIPYVFNSVKTGLNWSVSESGVVKVDLESTVIHTKDFNAVALGTFTYDPNNAESPSFIDMTAHVDKVQTKLVADYLPKSLPMSVHEWLKMGLVGGTGESADMILRGPLGNFPFADNSGIFYITANVVDAKLVYAKGWEPLEHIYGKFILDNTNITVLSDRVDIKGNIGEKVKVVIPDYSAESGVELIATAKAHGSTKSFMSYLVGTPINKIIGGIPQKAKTSGQGNLDLYLKVPFDDVKKTVVNGNYDFINNDLDLGLPGVPLIRDVNGRLNFTQYGVNIKNITAKALNSNAYLSAYTRESDVNHLMNFSIKIPDLDYQAVAYEYLPFFAPVITGFEQTNIKFTIGKHGLNELIATSDLRNITINAPPPAALQSNEARNLTVKIIPATQAKTVAINWSLGDTLKGIQYIGDSPNTTGQIALGKHAEYMTNPDKNSLINVNGQLESVNVEQWIALIGKLVSDKSHNEHNESLPYRQIEIDKLKSKQAKNPFPIQIAMNSNHIFLGKQDFGKGIGNVLVNKDGTAFNIYTPIASGYGDFMYRDKVVNLWLDKYMLYKKLPSKVKENIGYVPLNFLNGESKILAINLPDVNLNIANLYLQNHNLGAVKTFIHQRGNNLYMESGILVNPDYTVKFNGINYCFGCDSKRSYVNFEAVADVSNLGTLVYNLDFGNLIEHGQGSAQASLQWNGGFQDFKLFGNIGQVEGKFYAVNVPDIQTGVLGYVFKILDLQSIYKLFMDPKDLFKSGIFFDEIHLNLSLLTNRLELDKFTLYGPLLSLDGNGIINLEREDLDVLVSAKPHIGFAVALIAGVATLNPLIGLGVYGLELLTDGVQDKLVSATYSVTGQLNKPIIKKTKLKDNVVHNVSSTTQLEYGL